jgi:hypothetical protein
MWTMLATITEFFLLSCKSHCLSSGWEGHSPNIERLGQDPTQRSLSAQLSGSWMPLEIGGCLIPVAATGDVTNRDSEAADYGFP